ncbi:uncharacterized protein LOC110747260 isoform X2 [Prunus avium]|nr:uncharacterized protein LOC110747260 isoform X2 [Prunus avium]
MLPKKKSATTCKFHSLTKGKLCELDLSEIEGKMCLSSLGWLLTVSKDLKFSLIHPLNHARIELPDGHPNLPPAFFEAIRKFVLSSSPSWTSNYIVMVHGFSSLAFCRPGENWIKVNLSTPILVDLTYYKGQFYVVDLDGCVSVCEIEDGANQAKLRVVAPNFPKEPFGPMMKSRKLIYLVESAGALLLVLCLSNPKICDSTTGCKVFKVPFSTNGNSWADMEVKNLGNRSLFLCTNSSSISVEASENSRWKANCIYFMNNKHVYLRVDMDMGIFSMDDGQIERPFDKSYNVCYKGRHFETSHLWIEPSF